MRQIQPQLLSVTSKKFLLLITSVLIMLNSSMALADMNIAQRAFEKQHYNLALKEIRKELGTNHEAQFLMAQMYEKGLGIVQNPHRAIKWYARAADSGDLESSYALGALFESGAGGELPKNYSESRRWFQRSAEQGHANSQFRLGAMLNIGRGGAKNRTEALAWVAIAQESGSKLAKDFNDAHTINTAEKASVEQRKQHLLATIKQNNALKGAKK